MVICIIYSAPFVLKKDVYACEKSFASPKCRLYARLQKSKLKKLIITKDAVIYVRHTESSCAIFRLVKNHQAIKEII